ncbi:MAG: hypothetical protein ABIF85_00210 [Nanoarchaeota archaeon]|nr:hypothetical protein [Nanoarchaeota archaeon]MBU4300068.1 hypothetical protein [Nanoarchaeota archaeon]MBU4451869.1 hypothetical protein [Nanoarchaeota archaeon]MCG2724395.1 hypothetical protein [archaeon]
MKFKLFGRLKKEEPAAAAPAPPPETQASSKPQQNSAPTRPLPEERVSVLLSQGFAEPEIIRVLKEEGYSFQEIDSGITNVLKQKVSSDPAAFNASFQGMPVEDLSPVFRSNQADVLRDESDRRDKTAIIEEMEEVIETLIEEKFSRVLEELEHADKKFTDLNEKFHSLNSKLDTIESQGKGTFAAEIEKINAVDLKEETLEPRIASLEKAFKDIIPNLVDSIREVRETQASSKRREAHAREFAGDVPTSFETGSEEEKNEKESIFD